MFWDDEEQLQRRQEEQEANYAKTAFSSPSKLAARITPSRGTKPSDVGGGPSDNRNNGSNNSRRTRSMLASNEDKQTFNDITASTGVLLKSSHPVQQIAFLENSDNDSRYNHSVAQTTLITAKPGEDASIMNSTIKTRDTMTFKSTGDSLTYSEEKPLHNERASPQLSAPRANTATHSAPSNIDTRTSGPPAAAAAATTVTNSQTAATNRSQSLDLRTNDNQFHVIASLLVDRFEKELFSGKDSFTLSEFDRQQIDRMVPHRVRQNFVEAVQLRLQSCPVQPTRPIHLVLRKCEALGLDRNDSQNLLFASDGAVIYLGGNKQMLDDVSVAQSVEESPEHALARKQLLAELREASNLMAESVTPEAALFWRKHVVELQARLRKLHERNGVVRASGEAEDIMRNNERLMASLQENTGYVPPRDDEFQQIRSRGTEELRQSRSQARSPQHSNTGGRGASSPVVSATSRGDLSSNSNNKDPRSQRLPMVDVVAPGDLPGGYTFEAEIENKRFLATVPAGGVRAGETFSCFMKDFDQKDNGAPVGRWRDSWNDCFRYGLFHPLVLNAVFCPMVALAQVMTRLGFDFLGQPREDIPKSGPWSTFGMVKLILSFWVFLNIVILTGIGLKITADLGISGGDVTSLIMVNFAMFAYLVYATATTRGNLREAYHIREHQCIDVEDCICATVCMPCTICQMGRHTVSYDKYEAACCTDDGIFDETAHKRNFRQYDNEPHELPTRFI